MPTLRPRKRQSEAPAAAAARSSSQSKVATTAPVSTAVPASSSTTKKRTTRSTKNEKRPDEMTRSDEEHHGLLDGDDSTPEDVRPSPESLSWAQRNQWIVFALASGACAAFNGVFAKLTTTELTTNFSMAIARMLGLESVEDAIEYIVRGSFFGLNLVFNGVMWTLFTTALARGNSTTQVSIINTSSNFVITAILGFAIFSEALPPLWWLGAAMLVAGSVITGRKDEGASPKEGGREQRGDGDGDMGEGIALASGSGEGEGLSPLRTRARGGLLVDVGSGEEDEEEKSEDEDVADLRL